MPRAIRKSRSRNKSVCRKRCSFRDNIDLSYIREALRSSATTHRYIPLKREKIKKSSNEPKSKEEEKLRKDASSSIKPKNIIEHGIRYIMLPLHLFNICVWDSPAQTSSSKETKNTLSNKCEEKTTKISSPLLTRKISSLSSRTSSPASSSSGFSSSSSVSSKSLKINPTQPPSCILSPNLPVDHSNSSSISSQLPVKPPASISSSASSNARETQSNSLSIELSRSSSSTSSKSIEKSSQVSLNQLLKEESSDDSSDEMVTAPEDFDDSSNDQWSNARSSSFMNMSIDLEYLGHEKLSSNFTSDCPCEEPMDVSMEETNFQANLIGKLPSRGTKKNSIDERSTGNSSSSSIEDLRSSENFSTSSIDREIARIFQQACTSTSSSDDEDYPITSGRINNPFFDESTHTGILKYRSCAREEISDAAIRKKRTFCHHAQTPMIFQTKRSHRDHSESPRRLEDKIDLLKVRESKEGHKSRDLREGRKIHQQTDSAYSDEDVEMNFINESLSRLHAIPMTLQESVIEWMEQDLDYVADTEDSNDGSPLPLRSRINSVGKIALGSLKNDDFGFVGRENRERLNLNVEIDGNKKAAEFSDSPGNQYEVSCRCGDPKCLFTSVALRSDDGASSWNRNYPRAPSPLRHLYYNYPEFMAPPATVTPNIDKSLPWILIPCSANLA